MLCKWIIIRVTGCIERSKCTVLFKYKQVWEIRIKQIFYKTSKYRMREINLYLCTISSALMRNRKLIETNMTV